MDLLSQKISEKHPHTIAGVYRKIFSISKAFTGLFVMSLILVVADIVLSVGAVVYIGTITNYIKQGNIQSVYGCLKLGIPLAVVLIILSCMGQYMKKMYQTLAVEALVIAALERLLGTSLKEMQKMNVGDLIYRLNVDSEKISEGLLQTFFMMVHDGLLFTVALCHLSSINAYAGFAVFIFSLGLFAIRRIFDFQIKKLAKDISQIYGVVTGMIIEYIKGMDIVRAYNLQEILSKRYGGQLQQGIRIFKKSALITSLSNHTIPIANKVIISATTFYICLLSVKGIIPIGVILSFIFLIGRVQGPLFSIGRSMTQIQQGFVAAERLLAISKLPLEMDSQGKSVWVGKNSGVDVELEDVCFEYDKSRGVLNNVNLKVNAGEKVGLTGVSGSGKTTLIKIIAGLIPPDSGQVKIFGIHTADDLETIRQQIAYVPQTLGLFSTTIEDNISCGLCDVNSERLEMAARKADAHDFIMELERGYDSEVRENGNNFSGGQRQRILLARALFRNAPLILLDEPDSALDKNTVHNLYSTLTNLPRTHTLIVIGHNLEMLDGMDRIIVMEKGVVVEDRKLKGHKDD